MEELNVGSGKKCSSCGGTVAAGRKTCHNCGHSFATVTTEELTARIKAAESAVVALARMEFGDFFGHPFRGNQHSRNGGGLAEEKLQIHVFNPGDKHDHDKKDRERRERDFMDQMPGMMSSTLGSVEELGDTPGHEFHGNQYANGTQGGDHGEVVGKGRNTGDGREYKIKYKDGSHVYAEPGSIAHDLATGRANADGGKYTGSEGTPLKGVSPEEHAAGVARVNALVAKQPELEPFVEELKDAWKNDAGETSVQMMRNQVEEELHEVMDDYERGVNYTDDDANAAELDANSRMALIDAYAGENQPG